MHKPSLRTAATAVPCLPDILPKVEELKRATKLMVNDKLGANIQQINHRIITEAALNYHSVASDGHRTVIGG